MDIAWITRAEYLLNVGLGSSLNRPGSSVKESKKGDVGFIKRQLVREVLRWMRISNVHLHLFNFAEALKRFAIDTRDELITGNDRSRVILL